MTRDSSTHLSKREQIKRTNKKGASGLKKKKNEESDSDESNITDTDNEEIDMHEFRKYVQKIFPSKHIDKKIKAGEKLKKSSKKLLEKASDKELSNTDSEEKEKLSKKTKVKTMKYKNGKIIDVSDDDSISLGTNDTEDDSDYEDDDDSDYVDDDSDYTDDDDSDYTDDDSDYEEDLDDNDSEKKSKKSGKVNIIFTIGDIVKKANHLKDAQYDKDSEETEEDEDEDEDVDVSSEDEQKSEKEDKLSKRKSKKTEKNGKPNKTDSCEQKSLENTEDENLVLKQLKDLLSKNPKDTSIEKCIDVYEKDIKDKSKKKDKKEKKQKAKNMRIFRKTISDKSSMNDFTFYKKLDTENQKKIIKELREINKITKIEKPYRMTLLEADIPIDFKCAAFKKVNSLKYLETGSGEFYKIKNWVDTFMKIPFTTYRSLPFSIENGVENCHQFMENAQKTLDSAVYGLNDAKMQIMQMLGSLLTNPKAIGTSIAIHGPPGTGKTSLVKEGISKILDRPFAFIALGGATDSSFLEGHGYTYEGSTWGKIVQILIDSKCMNPVIYFDELDKISDTPRGEEIAGILTHLTDTTQNSQFHDKYFAEINFDLSKCLFIFSYNDESKVNPILKDRMYRIKTKGYSGKEKTLIANNYLLPKIREQVKFHKNDIVIPDDVIGYINENYCNKEDGVRNMKRCLEIIYTKLNLYRLMKPGTNLFESEMSLKVEFPFTVTKNIVDKLIKKEEDSMSKYIRDTLYI